jgi:multimeric flavodoxin WrbA
MKIVCIYGSPRKNGNSSSIADHFLAALTGPNDEVKFFQLNGLDFRGCQGCMICKGKYEKCILNDGLEEVLDNVREADILVLATPVYYYDVTGQVKCFVDRTWSYLKPDYETNPEPSRLLPGKTLVFIQSQGDPNPDMHNDIYPKYNLFFNIYGFKKSYLIRACGVNEPGEAKNKRDVMELAEQTAEKIKQKF